MLISEPPQSPATPPPSSILIVGGGLAALRSAAELRNQGFTGTLSVIAAEEGEPYDRPPLSTQLLSQPEPVWLAQEGYGSFTEHADEVLFGHRATDLRLSDQPGCGVTVVGQGRTGTVERCADAAVIATGAEPIRPPDWQEAVVLHTLDHARALGAALRQAARLIVIGAGWIGAEVATVAAGHGLEVVVLERGPAPGWQALGADVGALLTPAYRGLGIDLRCEHRVVAVSGNQVDVDGPMGAYRITADVVLAAVGVRPATDWLSGVLPLTARGALPVDQFGRLIDGPAQVRAVGDCADVFSPRDGIVPGGHWDTAVHAPSRMVADVLGVELRVPADPAPYVFSTQLGHELALVGSPPPVGSREIVMRGTPGDGSWTALYVSDGHLRAGLTVDRPRDVGALRKALSQPRYPRLDVSSARDLSRPLRRALVSDQPRGR